MQLKRYFAAVVDILLRGFSGLEPYVHTFIVQYYITQNVICLTQRELDTEHCMIVSCLNDV